MSDTSPTAGGFKHIEEAGDRSRLYRLALVELDRLVQRFAVGTITSGTLISRSVLLRKTYRRRLAQLMADPASPDGGETRESAGA